jgi:hypothetical protein
VPHREATFRLWVGATITILWASSLIADIAFERYDPPAGLGTLMLIVASALFGGPVVAEIRKRVNGGSDE